MSIEIKKNNKLDLDIPEFNCDDNPIGEHLNKYPMLKELNRFNFVGILGRPGSGKTSFLVSLLTGKGKNRILRKAYDNIIIVMPTSSRESMKKNPFEHHNSEKMFEELDYTNMEKIYQMIKASASNKETTLLILDDVTSALKNKEIQKMLRLLVYNRRHNKLSIYCLIQSYIAVPRELRKLFTNLISFKVGKVEFEILMSECFELQRDVALNLLQFAYQKPHDYLFLSIESQKMFQNFDEIIIHKPEDNDNKIEK